MCESITETLLNYNSGNIDLYNEENGCVSHATAGEQFVYKFLPSGIVECQTVNCLCCARDLRIM